MSVAEIAAYMGPDREQQLYAGAKAEGLITWYTSLAGDSYKALARAFESNYPGVRVEAFRSGGGELVTRMSEEAKARRPTFDALETTYDFTMVSRANQLTRPYNSPVLVTYPSEAKERRKKGSPSGPYFASPTWASAIIRIKSLPMPRPRASTACCIRNSKGKWRSLSMKARAHDRRDDQDQRRSVRQEA